MPRRKAPTIRPDLPRGYGYIQEAVAPDGLFKVQARWQERGKWRAKTFTSDTAQSVRDLAIDHLIEMHRARRDGRNVAPSMMKVADLMDVYIERSRAGWKPSTEHSYRRWSDQYIVPAIGAVRVMDLTRAHVQQMIDQLTGNKSAKTISSAVMLLRAACKHAVEMEIIARNPTHGTKLALSTRKPHVTWTREDVSTLLQQVADNPFMDAYYRLSLGTGIRPGEARALQWNDIDLVNDTMTIRRTATIDASGVSIVGTSTKTGHDRTVALTESVVLALRRWKEQQTPMLSGSPRRELWPFVFSTKPDGSMTSKITIQDRHRRIVEAAGIPWVTLHELRHTFATLAMRSGAHPLVVSQVLGHRSIMQTLDTYSHPSTGMQREALGDLDAMLHATTKVSENTKIEAKGT